MNDLQARIKAAIRDVPDFPKDGILFKDISTLLLQPDLANDILDALVSRFEHDDIDAIAGIESRGFLFGNALALRLNKPFVLIRKAGKLPAHKITQQYELEYGMAAIEMHSDAITAGQRVLIHDDLLATGGSAEAAAKLIQQAGGVVAGFSMLVELGFLQGAPRLAAVSGVLHSLVRY
jgi:adenine phosphoribosyltransferase